MSPECVKCGDEIEETVKQNQYTGQWVCVDCFNKLNCPDDREKYANI